MTKLTKYLPVLITIFVFNACRNIQPPTAPAETANIAGHVLLADYVLHYTPPFSGIQVSLDGTGYSTTTDDSGYFTLSKIPEGVYDVRFSKAGYGDIRWVGQAIQGGGNATTYWNGPDNNYRKDPTLFKQPDFVMHLTDAYCVDTSISGSPAYPALVTKGRYSGSCALANGGNVVYYSHSSDVSFLPGHYVNYYYDNVQYASWRVTDTTTHSFVNLIPMWNLNLDGFVSGDSIYVAMYGTPLLPSIEGDYFDPKSQTYVISSTNQTPSPVIGLKIP